MTRFVAQTRQNYVSVTPYNYSDTLIHGFQGTHQPAIWMGESGQVVVIPGTGSIKSRFEERGMDFDHEEEVVSASYYSVKLRGSTGETIFAEQSASKSYFRAGLPTPESLRSGSIQSGTPTLYLSKFHRAVHSSRSYSSNYHRFSCLSFIKNRVSLGDHLY